MTRPLSNSRARNTRRELDVEIGRKIRELRLASGVTLISLSRDLGYVSDCSLYQIEMGRSSAAAATVAQICRALGVESKEILGV